MAGRTKIYDVIIIGAGVSGCTAAIRLATKGASVLLLDRQEVPAFKAGESLAPSATPFLKQLGVFESFENGTHLVSLGNLSAWGNNQMAYQDFMIPGNGWHLDRTIFELELREKAREQSSVKVIYGSGVKQIERKRGNQWQVALQPPINSQFGSKWLLDCTGRRSYVGSKLGIRRIKDYGLLAYCKVYQGPVLSEQEAFSLIEAAPDGWWYTAPLPNQRRIVVFFTDTGSPYSKRYGTELVFERSLSKTVHVKSRLVKGLQSTKIIASPVESSSLMQYAGDQWLSAGDAAQSFDPISSQGLTNALFSGINAADSISSAENGDRHSIDSYKKILAKIWHNYQRLRRQVYKQEMRWTEYPFWQRKQEVELDYGPVVVP